MKLALLSNRVLIAVLVVAASITHAFAHTVSNSYLTLQSADGKVGEFHGQWDISLRDLQFVIGLDDNGDGNITWGELKNHQKQIADYAYSRLIIKGGLKVCGIHPDKQWVDTHADGAYAVLYFTVQCPVANARALDLDNNLLFDIDPTHRGILVFRDGSDTSTALLSPDKHKIILKLHAGAG